MFPKKNDLYKPAFPFCEPFLGSDCACLPIRVLSLWTREKRFPNTILEPGDTWQRAIFNTCQQTTILVIQSQPRRTAPRGEVNDWQTISHCCWRWRSLIAQNPDLWPKLPWWIWWFHLIAGTLLWAANRKELAHSTCTKRRRDRAMVKLTDARRGW